MCTVSCGDDSHCYSSSDFNNITPPVAIILRLFWLRVRNHRFLSVVLRRVPDTLTAVITAPHHAITNGSNNNKGRSNNPLIIT